MIFVTHSAGNLILANAISTGKCSLGESSRWVSSQGPFQGSKSATALMDYCQNPTGLFISGTYSIAELFSWIGFCPMKESNVALINEGGRHSHEALDRKYAKAQEAYRENVDAALCGTSAYGIVTQSSPKLKALSAISGHESANDGLVEFNSCIKSLPHDFQPYYRNNKWYRALINHEDGKFLRDGWWGAARRPIKWFECLF